MRALGQRRGAGWAQGPRAHRGHLADSSSSCSSGGTAGFHGEPGSGAEGLRSPRDTVGARDGGAESSPETGWLPGAPLSQRPLCSASVTFLCETGCVLELFVILLSFGEQFINEKGRD